MSQRKVALFVTCLVDLFRPTVGFAALRLLEEAGCDVHVPEAQVCCGQPAFNSGDREDARKVARGLIGAFEAYDYVVAPSGSCAGMLRKHYPELFAGDGEWEARGNALAAKTWELTSFLVDVLGFDGIDAVYDGNITYHDSCSGLRELGVKQQPRKLLGKVEGLEVTELPGAEICCGFGGTFCVKYADISNSIVMDKTKDIASTGAGTLLAGDLGCLMNMAGKLSREGSAIEVRHVAEVLAGMTGEVPPIGRGEKP
ncbi:MAG: (Fe-S)-binding protein [Rhodospirillales bacterium]